MMHLITNAIWVMVAPFTNMLVFALLKELVFDIFIFITETVLRCHLILYLCIPYCQSVMFCSNQIDTPPTTILAELQKS